MVIKVDLACEKCSKKIKKVLCDIPYIQNQVYDEKANTVTITVKCCSPDKVKQKICCKGGKTVKGIEIVKPPPPKPEKSTAEPKPDKPLVVEVVVELPKPPTKKPKNPKDCPKRPPPVARCPPPPRCPSPPSSPSPPRCPSPPTCSPPPRCLQPPPPPPKCPSPPPPKCPSPPRCLPPQPPPCPPPPPVCCRECYEGVGVGPCWAGYGRPAGPCYYGRPVYDSWGCGYKRGYCKSRCTDYICEENPNACAIL